MGNLAIMSQRKHRRIVGGSEVVMGGKYSVIARQLDDLAWTYDWYGNSLIKFIAKSIYALIKYEVVEVGKHGY